MAQISFLPAISIQRSHPQFKLLSLIVVLCAAFTCSAQSKPASDPDVLVLSNGDTLHGKFVSSIQGKLTFHSDVLGDLSLSWDKVKELHTTEKLAMVDKNLKLHGRKSTGPIPEGKVEVENEAVTLKPEQGEAHAPLPVKDALFIMDSATLDKELHHEPGFFSGWNGAATAGATLVTATENQYTVSGGIGLVRAIPTAPWLNPSNRTSIDFTGSYGKITQPGYTDPGSPPTFVPASSTKSALYHADAERDEFFSPRFFALVQTAFDHNYSQDLDLQQAYGGGIGWTVLKTPQQEASLKATVQYEKQAFISGASTGNQNLIGSTFGASYLLKTKLVTYTQGLAFIPAYNQPRAYSATETDTFAFPAYKNLSFSIGTTDSYLNDPPVSLPPTKRNSFQFTMGLTYAIKSKE
jgi:formylmethanofuran dehydrogenase subunit D